ncbi:MAG: rhodanese-like domain-containing protein [Burkholderiaceae bacterium]
MKFIIDNWMLFAVAIGSATMLFMPQIKGAGGGTLSAAGAVQLMNREKAVVIDVSDAEEFALGHVNNAKNVPFSELEDKLAGQVKNKDLPLILTCTSGARSNRAVAVAKKLGFSNVQAMAGGMKAWREANLPLEKA